MQKHATMTTASQTTSISTLNENNNTSRSSSNIGLLPRSCQRFRLSSLTAALRSQTHKPAESRLKRKEEHRIVVMGSARVGKSSIISQFLYDKYLTRYRQTVEELHRGEYELPDGASLTLDILDTSGAFQFPAMRALSISKSGAFILVYAVDDADTWDEVVRLREQIVTARGFRAPIVIVGNKIDVAYSDRKVSREMAEEIAIEHWQCGYIECSARSNPQCLEVFKELLVQANIRYNLSPAVRRRRQSLPSYAATENDRYYNVKYSLKRHSCAIS